MLLLCFLTHHEQLVFRAGGHIVGAFGCDDGTVVLTAGGAERARAQLDGPISCVELFGKRHGRLTGRSARQELWADKPPLVQWTPPISQATVDWASVSARSLKSSAAALSALNALRSASIRAASVIPELSLCVGGAEGFAVVFDHVERDGLERGAMLPGSHKHDSVLCVAAGDFDASGGLTQLAVGTFGGSVLLYHRDKDADPWIQTQVLPVGPPVYALTVLRQVDVLPFIVVSSATTLAILSYSIPSAEHILSERLEDAARVFLSGVVDQ